MSADGRALTFRVPGFSDIQSGFSATITVGGQTQVLSSASGTVSASPAISTDVTPYGTATVVSTTIHFAKEQVDLLFRMEKLSGVPGLLAQVGVRNAGLAPVGFVTATPIAFQGKVTGSHAEWLVTQLDTSCKVAPAVVAFGDIKEPLKVHEYGGLYRADGDGYFFGPVGTPIAYVAAVIERGAEDKLIFAYSADMSGVQVGPGETRWGQQVVLLAEPPQKALARWSPWVAQSHGACTDKGALSGWSSWAYHGFYITGKDLLSEIDAVRKSNGRLRPMVMQIDAGFRRETNRQDIAAVKFPEELGFYAKQITAVGARPGMLLGYRPRPEVAGIEERIKQSVQNGYTYLKINSTRLTISAEELIHKTRFEAKRERLAALRMFAGAETYMLYNDSRPDRATVGLMDANRTGRDADRLLIREAINDALRSYSLNGRWFAVDNDCYYMGTDIANVSEIAGGWPMVRTWMSMVGLSCGAAITGDPWHLESFQPYWRNVEVMTPPAKERTEVIDLCKSNEWPRLVGQVSRPWGDMTVALLWNPGTSERTVTLAFEEVGMDPAHRYAVWSFWDNRYLGVTKGSWTTPALAPSASQHLCFTDLDRVPDKPVLIGSGLHIYCGAAEIKNVIQRRYNIEIELTDAGARSGNLFIYSRLQPVWKGAAGCTVAEIASAGENVWRVRLNDRKCDTAQRITLGIILPVTQQLWFWALISLVAASLLFAAWRYIAWLKIQRERGLEQERTRIAMDLHDDLGGGLTEVAMLSEVARQDMDRPDQVSAHLQRIFRSSREMTQALDEIVWAVNPANDTLEKLITFTGEFARELLEPAGIRCRLDSPADVPGLELKSRVRHQICMVMKECLHNIVKHSRAGEVHIRIELTGRNLDVVIKDDGTGFDMAAFVDKAGSHNGLGNMRRRMLDIHGIFEIQSKHGSGTTVSLQVRI